MGALLKVTIIGVILAALGERLVQLTDESQCGPGGEDKRKVNQSDQRRRHLHRMNFFREIDPIDLPNCRLLKGIEYGSEDIEILPNGLAFISSGMKYPGVISFAPERPGEIFLLDLNAEDLLPSSLRISKGFDVSSFNPHGISTYIDEKDDSVYLFVVNHPQHQTAIEIFRFEEEENYLVHLKTIRHSALNSVNNIFAVGPESFYATNDHYFTNFNMKPLEMIFGTSWANVVYYSPGDVRQVATGFHLANGIAMSNDEKFIYVADFTGHTINVLEKHADWSLSPVKVVQLETMPDNLWVDPVTGDVWMGALPNAFKVFFYKPTDVPGSEVIRIQNIHSDNPIVTTVYANNGSVLQAATVAAVYKNNLFVGTAFHKALYCQL